MKLYTEEEIKKTFGFGLNEISFKGYMNAMTPIELPSDEEIYNEAQIKKDNIKLLPFDMASFQFGALWLRDKIQGGNK